MKYFVNFINMQTYHLSFLLFTENNQYFNPQSYPLMESKTLALFIGYPHYPQVLWIKSIPNQKFCTNLQNRYFELSTDLSTLSTGPSYPQNI